VPPPKRGGRASRGKVTSGRKAGRPPKASELPGEFAALRNLGASVRAARVASGLTQEAAAALADIDYKRWQRIEQGAVNPTLRTLLRVAEVLEVDAWRLLAPRRRG
jgi:DNA-binding XRE family transcriptional regulator